jgi:hypothetical protein
MTGAAFFRHDGSIVPVREKTGEHSLTVSIVGLGHLICLLENPRQENGRGVIEGRFYLP